MAAEPSGHAAREVAHSQLIHPRAGVPELSRGLGTALHTSDGKTGGSDPWGMYVGKKKTPLPATNEY